MFTTDRRTLRGLTLVLLALFCQCFVAWANEPDPATADAPALQAPQSNTTNNPHIKGVIVDAETGDSIAYAKLQYQGQTKVYTSSFRGEFDIPRNLKQQLTITAFGYKPVRLTVGTNTGQRVIRMKPDLTNLGQVEIVAKKKKYTRKDNPAVELMQRVIAANKQTDLRKTHDFVRYNNYQKISLARNDVSPDSLNEQGEKNKKQWYIDQVTYCPQNEKYILPINYEETVSEYTYRRSSDTERKKVIGKRSEGILQQLDLGESVNVILADVFKDVDVYDNRVDLFQFQFLSPIGSGATSFYRYFITDTLSVGDDRCIKLSFLPNNPQDFGFSGNIYVLADSSLHLRRCELSVPDQSQVNWVSKLKIDIEYEQLETGEWAQTKDDMFCELTALSFLPRAAVIRTTRRTGYDFGPIPDEAFTGMGDLRIEEGSDQRDSTFWALNRPQQLTRGEQNMSEYVKGVSKSQWYGVFITAAKVFLENYIGLGSKKHPPLLDFGPLNTLVSKNPLDGVRTRISFATTSNLSKHWFATSYITKGWGSGPGLKLYGGGEITYSFNRKNKTPDEYPKRKVYVKGGYDNMAPADRFSAHDKDNIFTMFKWGGDRKRLAYSQARLGFDWEQYGGLEYKFHYNWENQWGMGELEGQRMKISEFQVGLRYAPGEKIITTKERRIKVNRNTPVFEFTHTSGVKGFLGGSHNYNSTELSAYYRLWLNDWGRLTSYGRAGIQWNSVPYLQLLQPPANMSLVAQHHTFNLMSDMEFLNDRYVLLDLEWDLAGKLFNRIPLVKKLKWREYIGFKGLWGGMSEKNRPVFKDTEGKWVNKFDSDPWPTGSDIMDPGKPYLEVAVGIHNILNVFCVEYVRRLTYTDHGQVNGVRFKFEASF